MADGPDQTQSYDLGALQALLGRVAQGAMTPEAALEQLRTLPFEQVDSFATLDHHRALRRGFPETIFCAGKTPEQVAAIAERFAARSDRVLGTRATPEHFAAAQARVRGLEYDATARVLWLNRDATPGHEGVAVVCAGTSDLPVAEEAARTLEVLGHRPRRLSDVGVAGLHRLLAHVPTLRAMNVVVVVAGMEGALPSVVAGLVSCPVIAVPTSVGYGASLGGIAALLAMLNSCSPGIAVVNIDNGFGAAYLAATINRAIVQASRKGPGSPGHEAADAVRADG